MVLIEAVDQEDRLRAELPELDAMIQDGLITLERVEVIAYRAGSDRGSAWKFEPSSASG